MAHKMKNEMKNFYEAPKAELLKVNTEDIMFLSSESDGFGGESSWGNLVG